VGVHLVQRREHLGLVMMKHDDEVWLRCFVDVLLIVGIVSMSNVQVVMVVPDVMCKDSE
jgi:hypothetical protein